MNQILYVDKSKKTKTVEIHKVVCFFAISLVVFGIIMVGQGVYAKVKNAAYEKSMAGSIPVATMEKEGQNVKIRVNHTKPIDKIEYNWNGQDSKTIRGNNRRSIEESIELPAGNNTLNVTVTDINGKTGNYHQDFSVETGKDITKPQITLNIEGNYIKITATDETALSYVTYRWNEEQEQKLQPDGTDNAKIEAKIEILKGQNKLTVIAVDTSNNTATKEETFEGRVKPEVEVYVDGDSFLIRAKCESNIQKIDYTFNDKDYSVQYEPSQTMEYHQKLVEGLNKIHVKAYSTEGTVGVYEGEYTYTKNH